ncbi:MAG: hypothetical protein ACLFSJ_06765 [Halorhodospira sp.]
MAHAEPEPPLEPPPWTLTGRGIVLLLRMPPAWVRRHAGLPERLQRHYNGGPGLAMLVAYDDSPVGPYRELLFSPGTCFRERRHVITRILVDSPASTRSGRANWGIPKETVPIAWSAADCRGVERVRVGDGLLEAALRVSERPALPVSTALWPLRLYHELEGRAYRVEAHARGRLRRAPVAIERLDPARFPDIRQAPRIAALAAAPFRLTFPAAAIEPLG